MQGAIVNIPPAIEESLLTALRRNRYSFSALADERGLSTEQLLSWSRGHEDELDQLEHLQQRSLRLREANLRSLSLDKLEKLLTSDATDPVEIRRAAVAVLRATNPRAQSVSHSALRTPHSALEDDDEDVVDDDTDSDDDNGYRPPYADDFDLCEFDLPRPDRGHHDAARCAVICLRKPDTPRTNSGTAALFANMAPQATVLGLPVPADVHAFNDLAAATLVPHFMSASSASTTHLDRTDSTASYRISLKLRKSFKEPARESAAFLFSLIRSQTPPTRGCWLVQSITEMPVSPATDESEGASSKRASGSALKSQIPNSKSTPDSG